MHYTRKIFLGISISIIITVISFSISYYLSLKYNYDLGMIVQIPFLLFTIPAILYFKKKGQLNFKIKKLEAYSILKIFIISYVVSIFLQFISGLTNALFNGPASKGESINVNLWVYFLTMFFLSSIAEELLFRGFLLNMLDSLKHKKVKIFTLEISYSILLSGFVYGLVHLIYFIYGQHYALIVGVAMSAFVMGTLAGYFQEKHENNFLAAVLTHMASMLVALTGIIVTVLIS
jgi:membrane protease YdiL (CAAX protease family)